MKAKLIYEFKEKSDPIEDIGIGIAGIPTTKVWVIKTEKQTYIEQIFLSEEKAKRIAKEKNDEAYKLSRKINSMMSNKEFEEFWKKNNKLRIFKVMTLDDAIDSIISNIYDESRYDSNY